MAQQDMDVIAVSFPTSSPHQVVLIQMVEELDVQHTVGVVYLHHSAVEWVEEVEAGALQLSGGVDTALRSLSLLLIGDHEKEKEEDERLH